jgi:hypothetical protein
LTIPNTHTKTLANSQAQGPEFKPQCRQKKKVILKNCRINSERLPFGNRNLYVLRKFTKLTGSQGKHSFLVPIFCLETIFSKRKLGSDIWNNYHRWLLPRFYVCYTRNYCPLCTCYMFPDVKALFTPSSRALQKLGI